MAWFRGVGFVLGAVGLVLFLGAFAYGLAAQADPACKGFKTCEREHFDTALGRVLFFWTAGIVMLAAGVAMLVMHLRQQQDVSAPPVVRAAPSTGTGPRVAVRPPTKR